MQSDVRWCRAHQAHAGVCTQQVGASAAAPALPATTPSIHHVVRRHPEQTREGRSSSHHHCSHPDRTALLILAMHAEDEVANTRSERAVADHGQRRLNATLASLVRRQSSRESRVEQSVAVLHPNRKSEPLPCGTRCHLLRSALRQTMRRQPGDGRALTAQVHPEPHPEARVEVARIRQAWLLVSVADARCVGRWLVCTLVHVQTASYSKTKEGAKGAAVNLHGWVLWYLASNVPWWWGHPFRQVVCNAPAQERIALTSLLSASCVLKRKTPSCGHLEHVFDGLSG